MPIPLLNKAQILGATDIVYEIVPVPEWGGDVRVRSLTGSERARITKATTVTDSKGTSIDFARMQALAIVAGCVDEDGKQLFVADDVPALNAKSSKALFRLFQVITRLSGMDSEAEEAAAKNSDSTQSDDLSFG